MTRELIEKLRAATPSRELDAEVAVALGWKHLDSVVWLTPDNEVWSSPAYFTSSLDAARTAVPEDFWVEITENAKGFRVVLIRKSSMGLVVKGDHRYEPIATLIAAFEARLVAT